ncbi:MAG: AAA family ATPase, partial [Candidatus Dormibacteraeota bacterium]|nr:AAA family ATPase [Candidatus Dormibacteraeota bacterium]
MIGTMLRARDAELQAIDRLLMSAGSGRGGGLLLSGEPGVGKTALLAHARGRAEGMLVLRAGPVEPESRLTYAALHELLRPLAGRVGSLPSPQALALGVALGQVAGEGTPDPFLVSLATLTLLTEAAAERPVLCLVDDAQWADPASLAVLAFVARRLESDPIALLVATRTGETPALEAAGVEELGVGGLPPETAAALLEERWGARLAPQVRDALVRASGGNPLALTELAASLDPDQLSGRQALPDPLPLAGELERVYMERVRLRRPHLRSLALLCAAEGSGSVAAVVRAAGELGIEDPLRGLSDLSDLVRTEGSSFAFGHPLARSAVYQGADPSERRAAHLALAAALGDGEAESDRRAWHRAQAA